MQLRAQEAQQIFKEINKLKIGVIGDFALDFYFDIEQKTGEFSLETNHEVFWGSKPTASLGGAGNVVANLASLGAKNIHVFGVTGDDVFGKEIEAQFDDLSINKDGILKLKYCDTSTYVKPRIGNSEINRIDFGTKNFIDDLDFNIVLKQLELALPNLDLLIINQQFRQPLLSASRIEIVNKLFEKFPNCKVIADLRTFGSMFRNGILKVNAKELANLLSIDDLKENDTVACILAARQLSFQINCSLLLTRGQYGCLFFDKTNIILADAINITSPIDTVGAGDTMVAAFAVAYASGETIINSLIFANLAAAVTIQKLNQTGTATESEIINLMNKLKK